MGNSEETPHRELLLHRFRGTEDWPKSRNGQWRGAFKEGIKVLPYPEWTGHRRGAFKRSLAQVWVRQGRNACKESEQGTRPKESGHIQNGQGRCAFTSVPSLSLENPGCSPALGPITQQLTFPSTGSLGVGFRDISRQGEAFPKAYYLSPSPSPVETSGTPGPMKQRNGQGSRPRHSLPGASKCPGQHPLPQRAQG